MSIFIIRLIGKNTLLFSFSHMSFYIKNIEENSHGVCIDKTAGENIRKRAQCFNNRNSNIKNTVLKRKLSSRIETYSNVITFNFKKLHDHLKL